MSKFKKGDRVRCIRQSSVLGLVVGEVYTVLNDYGGCNIYLENHSVSNVGVLRNRFELVEPRYTWESKFNIGDKVKWDYENGVFEIEEVRIYNYGTFYVLSFGRHAKESELTLYKEPKVKELSVKEISELLGYEVKVVK